MLTKKSYYIVLKSLILLIGTVIIGYPVYLTVITGLKTTQETAENFFALPKALYFGNFIEVINKANFPTFLFNSILITGVSLVLIVILAPITSYAIARHLDNTYFKFLFGYITIGIFIPFQVIMIPLTKLMTKLDLLNQGGMIVIYLTFALIQSVFLYVGYIKTLPVDMEEAAYMDGCTIGQSYVKVIFPLLKPMTATVVVMNALWIWNDFLLPLLILNRSQDYWTIQLFQYNFKSQYTFNYNLAFASFFLSTLPVVLIYVLMQKHIVSGITQGAVKT